MPRLPSNLPSTPPNWVTDPGWWLERNPVGYADQYAIQRGMWSDLVALARRNLNSRSTSRNFDARLTTELFVWATLAKGLSSSKANELLAAVMGPSPRYDMKAASMLLWAARFPNARPADIGIEGENADPLFLMREGATYPSYSPAFGTYRANRASMTVFAEPDSMWGGASAPAPTPTPSTPSATDGGKPTGGPIGVAEPKPDAGALAGSVASSSAMKTIAPLIVVLAIVAVLAFFALRGGSGDNMGDAEARRILGVGPNASQDEIRAAWRNKSFDAAPGPDGRSSPEFARINLAYEVLSRAPQPSATRLRANPAHLHR